MKLELKGKSFGIFLGICISFISVILTSSVLKMHLESGTDSDLLYPAVFFLDVFYSEKFIWSVPPSPGFFPELTLFGFTFFLFRNYFLSYYIYGIVSALFSWYSLYSFYQGIDFSDPDDESDWEEPEENHSLLYSFVIVLFFHVFLLFLPDKFGIFYFIGYHGFVFFSLPFLFFSIFSKSAFRVKYGLLFFLIFLGASVSDSHFFSQIFLPFLVSVSIFFIYKERSILAFKKIVNKYIICIGLGIVSGKYLLSWKIIKEYIFIPSVPVFSQVSQNFRSGVWLSNIPQSWDLIKNDNFGFGENSILFYFWLFIFVLNIISIFIYIKNNSREYLLKRPIEIGLFLFFIFSILFSVSFQLVLGVWMGPRYIWALYLFPFIYLPVSMNYHFKKMNLYFILGTLQISIILGVSSFKGIYKKFPIRKDIQCILDYTERKNIRYLLTDYWYAKYLRLASENRLITIALTNDLELYPWIDNSFHYQSREYSLLLLNHLDRQKIYSKFGQEIIEISCEDSILFYFPSPVPIYKR